MSGITVTPEAARVINRMRDRAILALGEGDNGAMPSLVAALATLMTWGGDLRVMPDGGGDECISLYCEQRTNDGSLVMNFGIISHARPGRLEWGFHS